MGKKCHVARKLVKVPQKSSDGALLCEEKAQLDCLITKNRPEMGLERLVELSTISYGSTLAIHTSASPTICARS